MMQNDQPHKTMMLRKHLRRLAFCQKRRLNTSLQARLNRYHNQERIRFCFRFPFLKDLENTPNYEWDIYYIYVREDRNSDNYNLLHDYVFTLNNTESNIEIHFSDIEEPLRCVFTNETKKLSVVNGVNMLIQQLQDTYYITFENKGVYFDIETRNIDLDELITILEMITQ